MQQKPINYWYCPQCECEVDSRNVTNDEKHDNCGTEVEYRQHVQTPIEKAIEELYNLRDQYDYDPAEQSAIDKSIEKLKSILPYEKKHLHDVAEKAFQEGYQHEAFDTYKDKEDYLNQNHPL